MRRASSEAAPVDADAHRLAVADRRLDHGGELLVALGALADVARVDAVLGERARALGELRQQLVAVVVEVADQRHVAAGGVQPRADRGHLRGRLRRVHRDAHQLRAGAPQLLDLARRRCGVGGVGIGHGLHHHRRAAADGDRAHHDAARRPARGHGYCSVKRATSTLT
jgi:hypothetical protein